MMPFLWASSSRQLFHPVTTGSCIFPGGRQSGGSEQKGPDCIVSQSEQHQHKPPASEIRSALHGAGPPWELDQLCAVSFEGEQHSDI